jgi:hypothetical protein
MRQRIEFFPETLPRNPYSRIWEKLKSRKKVRRIPERLRIEYLREILPGIRTVESGKSLKVVKKSVEFLIA